MIISQKVNAEVGQRAPVRQGKQLGGCCRRVYEAPAQRKRALEEAQMGATLVSFTPWSCFRSRSLKEAFYDQG